MHNDRITIWKNSLFILFSQIIRLVTVLLISVGIARLYGPETFGQFSIAFTIANICLIIADFGFDVLLTTEISKNRDIAFLLCRKYFSIKIIFTAISFLIMISIPIFQTFSENSRTLIYVLTLYVVFSTITNFFYAVFRGFEKFEYETKISFISNLTLLIFLGIFGFMKTPLVQLMLIFIVARFLGVVLSVIKSNSLVGSSIIKIDFSGWKGVINQILVFGIHFIFGNLFFQLDTVLLGIWKGDHAAGIYRSAFNLMILILLIPDILISTFLPLLSRLHLENIEKWKSLNRLLYKILLFVSLPIALILFFSSEQIITIIYGKELYNEAVPILKIFSFIIIIRFVVEPYALLMTTSKRQHIRMIIVIIATIVSFSLNYFIIPEYGIMGAALVSLGINFMAGAGYIIAGKYDSVKWFVEVRVISVIISVIVLAFLLNYFHAQIIFLSVSLIIYLFIVYFIGLTNKDKKMILTEFSIKGV